MFECFCCWRHPIRFREGFWFAFPRFCHWWDVKTSKGDFFYISRVSLNGSQADPLFIYLLFACRMTRGYEDVSSKQARRRKGTLWEMPTASSLVAAMSAEELRFYSQVPVDIGLEMSNSLTASTIREANNDIYFTRE